MEDFNTMEKTSFYFELKYYFILNTSFRLEI